MGGSRLCGSIVYLTISYPPRILALQTASQKEQAFLALDLAPVHGESLLHTPEFRRQGLSFVGNVGFKLDICKPKVKEVRFA